MCQKASNWASVNTLGPTAWNTLFHLFVYILYYLVADQSSALFGWLFVCFWFFHFFLVYVFSIQGLHSMWKDVMYLTYLNSFFSLLPALLLPSISGSPSLFPITYLLFCLFKIICNIGFLYKKTCESCISDFRKSVTLPCYFSFCTYYLTSLYISKFHQITKFLM